MNDVILTATVGVVALAASTMAAVTGFGGAVIMLPILVWVFGVRDAIPILAIYQLIGNLSRVWFNRRELSLPVVGWFALGAVPAAAAGGVVFATAPVPALVRLLGVFLIGTVVYRRSPWGKWRNMRLRSFLPLGAISGALSAIIGSVGPFIAPFFLAYGLIRGGYIGTEALASAIMHGVKLGVYGGYSLLSVQTILVGFAIGGVSFAGSYIGKKILHRIPENLFPYLIEGVLLTAGLLFLVQG